ncbi:hypothetical protein NDI44_09625 [Trichocoleus sp. DQ-A3]|uniref:hypothetical protein n=1 Tax=Coleofasciculus sp. FACHB-125 TaxID=2692784 RepID=UPI0030DCE88D
MAQRQQVSSSSTSEVLPSNAQTDVPNVPNPSGNWLLISRNDDNGKQSYFDKNSLLYRESQVKFWQKIVAPLEGYSTESYVLADCSSGSFKYLRLRNFEGNNLTDDFYPNKGIEQASINTLQGNVIQYACSHR